MRHVITTYATLIVFLLMVFLCTTMTGAAVEMTEAKEFKAQVVAEIENSNFNPYVIEACKKQALAAGYELQITTYIYDKRYDMQTAEVVLMYPYHLPMFGVAEIRTTRGIAK